MYQLFKNPAHSYLSSYPSSSLYLSLAPPFPLPQSSPLSHLSIISILSPPSGRPCALTYPSQSAAAVTSGQEVKAKVECHTHRVTVMPGCCVACEWRVQSARRCGEPLTPWLLPELALSRAEVSAKGLSSPLPLYLQVTITIVVIAAIRAADTIIFPFCVRSL